MHINNKAIVNLLYFISFLLTFIFYSNIVLFHLNPYFNDLAGHFSSAYFFKKGLFHQYNHYNLGGYIQGLFYPPLQDILINFINLFTDFYLSCKIYLILIFFIFLWSVFSFSQCFKKQLSRVLFLLFILTILFLDKFNYLIYLQGISIEDTLVIGLSAQLLSMSFFLLYLRNIFLGKFDFFTIFLLFSILISHIVISMIAIFITLLYIFISKDINKLKIILLPILMASFFIIPFVSYCFYINSSEVVVRVHPENIIFFLTSSCVMFFYYGKIEGEFRFFLRTLWLFCIIIGFIVSLSEILNFLVIKNPIPFHFYRFNFFIFFIFFVSTIFASENIKNRNTYYAYLFFLIIFFTGILQYHKMKIISKEFIDNYFNEVKLLKIFPEPILNNEVNNFVFTSENYSPYNQFRSFQELLRLNGNKFTSVQGIYWESNFSTNILDSYMGSLFGIEGGVTNHVQLDFNSCDQYMVFLDFFIKDYAINYIILDKQYYYDSNIIPANKRICLNYILENGGTNYFKFIKNRTIDFSISNKIYNKYIYQIENKNIKFSNSVSEYMLDDVEILSKNTKFWFKPYFENIIHSGADIYNFYKNFVFEKNLLHEEENEVSMHSKKSYNYNIVFNTLSSGKYKLYAPEKGLIKVKLNYMPGLSVYDEKNNKIPINRGVNFFYFYGKGSYLIEYEKPLIYYISYAISLVSIAAFVGFYFRKIHNIF